MSNIGYIYDWQSWSLLPCCIYKLHNLSVESNIFTYFLYFYMWNPLFIVTVNVIAHAQAYTFLCRYYHDYAQYCYNISISEWAQKLHQQYCSFVYSYALASVPIYRCTSATKILYSANKKPESFLFHSKYIFLRFLRNMNHRRVFSSKDVNPKSMKSAQNDGQIQFQNWTAAGCW